MVKRGAGDPKEIDLYAAAVAVAAADVDVDVDVDALGAGDPKEVTFLQSTSLAFGYSTDNKRATIKEEQQ